MPTVYVSFSAEINQQTSEVLMAVCAEQITKGADTIYLMLSTPGGRVINGITAYNFLKSLPCKLVTHNMGSVNSIGNVIFLAGQERYACPNSSFMFHGVGFDITTATRFEEKDLVERLDSIQADQRKIGAIIADRTGISSEEVQKLFLQAATRYPDYAKANGIVHDIRDAQVPNGAPLLQLVFKR